MTLPPGASAVFVVLLVLFTGVFVIANWRQGGAR
jgi:hypothetical protein